MQTTSNTYQNNSFRAYLTSKNTAEKARVNYIYGFQGQEKDDEIKGAGNSLNFEYRMHDPRVGRFFAVDPLAKKYPYYTPYQFSGNKVIHLIELEGLEESLPTYLLSAPNTDEHAVINLGEYSNITTVDGVDYNATTGKVFDESERGTIQYRYYALGDKDGNLLDYDGSWDITKGQLPEGVYLYELSAKRNIDGTLVLGKDGDILPDIRGENWLGSTYIGPNNPTTADGKADYRYEAQDLMDQAAKFHDYEYDFEGAAGVAGATINFKVISADENLTAVAKSVLEYHGDGTTKDPYTSKLISDETKKRAEQVNILFEILSSGKKGKYIPALWLFELTK
jgi:RHS repeat-associated protein